MQTLILIWLAMLACVASGFAQHTAHPVVTARLTNHSAYTSEHPTELITKEMSKKNAKRYYETHKSS